MEKRSRGSICGMLVFCLAFACTVLPRNAQAGKIEPNDDCLDTCDGMCKMCITFCEFSSEDEKDFGACVKKCAALRFSCRMFCEVDFEGESANAPSQSLSEAKKYMAASSGALKQLYYAKLRKKRIEREERYRGCTKFCVEVDVICFLRTCRIWRGDIMVCDAMCQKGARSCHQQCRTLYDNKLDFL